MIRVIFFSIVTVYFFNFLIFSSSDVLQDLTNSNLQSAKIKSPSRKSTSHSLSNIDKENDEISPLAPTKKRSRLSEDFFEIEENFIKLKELNHNRNIFDLQLFGVSNFQNEQKVINNLLYKFCASEDLAQILKDTNTVAYLKKDSGSYMNLLNIIEKSVYLTPKDFIDTAINCGWESIIFLNQDCISIKEIFIQKILSTSIKNQQNGARYFDLYTHNKEIYDSRLEQFKKLLSSK